MIGFIVGTTFCGLADKYYLLFLARVLTGVFGGVLNALILIFVTDTIPFERREKL